MEAAIGIEPGVQGFAGSFGRILTDTGGKNLLVRRGARTSANEGESRRPRDGRGMERRTIGSERRRAGATHPHGPR